LITGGKDTSIRKWDDTKGQLIDEHSLHSSEVVHLEVINDFLISVGLDNKLFKFDLIKNEKVGTYKAKFLISSIKILVPDETDAEVLDLPNRTSKED